MMVNMILVSACLADMKTRYDGDSRPDDTIIRMVTAGEAIPVCPEILGGLQTPREAADIEPGCGWDVLEGKSNVTTDSGKDVTREFLRGAEIVLELASSVGAKRAILKSKSASCGCGRREEDGVTAALLKKNGIEVLSEIDINEQKGEFSEHKEYE
jgi:uncharacterized protein YbbK (DUF523 family)